MSSYLSPSHRRDFISSLELASATSDVEKAVEQATTTLLRTYFERRYGSSNVQLTFPYSTDGLITVHVRVENRSFAVLVEAKRDKEFATSRRDVIAVLAQVVHYLHTFQSEEGKMPTAVVVVDNNEIFALPTSTLSRHVLGNYDWSISPSQAGTKNKALVSALENDNNIRPYIHTVSAEAFDPEEFCEDVCNKANVDAPIRIQVSTQNLQRLFLNFSFDIFDGAGSATSTRRQAEIFLRTLRGDTEIYPHPRKRNVLIVDGKEVAGVHLRRFEAFWQQYDSSGYSLSELKQITEIGDTLIEDAERRFSGDFWTPKTWVDHAHEVMKEQLGEDYRDKYVFWDPAAGSKNLTRDYRFKELYSSTLHDTELAIASEYNVDSTAFQYDFLNDDMNLHGYTRQDFINDPELCKRFKLPSSLVTALVEQRPIVFFANPPYGSNGNGTKTDGRKKGIATTSVLDIMPDQFGHAKQELYTQFVYRVQLLAELFEYTSDFHIFFFFNKGFLTSPNFGKFTQQLTGQFTFNKGFMLNAGEFNGTSAAWGIIFSHFQIGGSNQKTFDFDVFRSTSTLEVEKITNWKACMAEKGNTISDWLAEIPLQKDVDSTAPLTKNGLDAPTSKSVRCKPRKGWIGYLHNHGNNVQYSDKYTGMYSQGFAGANGRDITRDNFERAAITFSIRRSVQEVIAQEKQLWVKDKDIFTRPPQELLTPEFTADCVVYSLFDRQSSQTSLRDYEYGGKTHRVVNEFFPFSKEDMTAAAVAHRVRDIEIDADADSERFVYTWLRNHEGDLSSEARELLDFVLDIYIKSMPYRVAMDEEHPRYNVLTWDAGWKQINAMVFGKDRVTDTFMPELPTFKQLRLALGNKIAEQAIEAGVI